MDQDLSGPDRALLTKYRRSVAVFLFGAVLLVVLLGTLYKAINTLEYLNVAEAERDHWQRPEQVVAALKLKQGSAVADVGSGAGYFALKLSRAVGKSGRVLAVDIQRLPLVFLWIRASLGGDQNINFLLGSSDNPRLPIGALDAVLIANTYHEFAKPDSMVDRTFRALRCGGRLVVLDRSLPLRAPGDEHGHRHGIAPEMVEDQLRQKGFEILQRDDRFVERSSGERWWLLVAQKPGADILLLKAADGRSTTHRI